MTEITTSASSPYSSQFSYAQSDLNHGNANPTYDYGVDSQNSLGDSPMSVYSSGKAKSSGSTGSNEKELEKKVREEIFRNEISTVNGEMQQMSNAEKNSPNSGAFSEVD